jgi:hypothetical protein
MSRVLLSLLVLSLVTFRVTRFLISDTLIDGQRDWVLKRVLRNWAIDHDGEVIPEPTARAANLIALWRQGLAAHARGASRLGRAGSVLLAWATWDHARPPIFWGGWLQPWIGDLYWLAESGALTTDVLVSPRSASAGSWTS